MHNNIISMQTWLDLSRKLHVFLNKYNKIMCNMAIG